METTLVLNPVIQDLLQSLLIMIIGAAIVAATYQQVVYVRVKVGKERFDQFMGYVRLAIRAAEQLGLKGAIENEGAKKKALAIQIVQQWLNARGLTGFDADKISDAIEAALREGIHKGFNIELIESVQVEALPAPKDEEV